MKKKRKTILGSDHILIPKNYDIVSNILSRVPVKTLMRFKSVSKDWFYLIQHDQYFHDLHLSRPHNYPMLLFSVRLDDTQISLSPMDLHGCAATSHAHNIIVPVRERLLKPINGLVCIREYSECKSPFYIYNLSTREERRLGILKEEREILSRLLGFPRIVSYGLGFDPISKIHKVVRIWHACNSMFCDVFTVGEDACWRRIDEVPPCMIARDCVYANGSIFWKKLGGYDFIVAFDVGSEKFRTISIPDFVHFKFDLLEIDDCVSLTERLLVVSTTKNTFVFWILHEDPYEKKSSTWIEETIHVDWKRDTIINLAFEAIAGTDLIIIAHTQKITSNTKKNRVYHLYDRKKKTSKMVTVTNQTSSMTSFLGSLFLC